MSEVKNVKLREKTAEWGGKRAKHRILGNTTFKGQKGEVCTEDQRGVTGKMKKEVCHKKPRKYKSFNEKGVLKCSYCLAMTEPLLAAIRGISVAWQLRMELSMNNEGQKNKDSKSSLTTKVWLRRAGQRIRQMKTWAFFLKDAKSLFIS